MLRISKVIENLFKNQFFGETFYLLIQFISSIYARYIIKLKKKVMRKKYTKAELAKVREAKDMTVLGELVGKLAVNIKDMSVAEINTAASV